MAGPEGENGPEVVEATSRQEAVYTRTGERVWFEADPEKGLGEVGIETIERGRVIANPDGLVRLVGGEGYAVEVVGSPGEDVIYVNRIKGEDGREETLITVENKDLVVDVEGDRVEINADLKDQAGDVTLVVQEGQLFFKVLDPTTGKDVFIPFNLKDALLVAELRRQKTPATARIERVLEEIF